MSGADDTLAAKRELRLEMKRRLRNLPQPRFKAAGLYVLDSLRSEPEWRSAGTVCAFLSMPSEIDTEELCAEALASGKTLCLPRADAEELSFRVCGLGGPWAEGPFGIREPLESAPPADFSRLPGPILVIVPGLAFTPGGDRLGRGKGYYDRFLRLLKTLRSDSAAIGIGLSEQLLSALPTDARDERLDAVLC